MTDFNLPQPIEDYFDSDKRDAEAVASCFTDQAVVKDEGQIHCGLGAIESWKTETSAKYSYSSKPFAVEQSDRHCIVTSRLTGNFPGSPVDLRYIFRLEREKIAFLEITP